MLSRDFTYFASHGQRPYREYFDDLIESQKKKKMNVIIVYKNKDFHGLQKEKRRKVKDFAKFERKRDRL